MKKGVGHRPATNLEMAITLSFPHLALLFWLLS
jgi:hypothetical protein